MGREAICDIDYDGRLGRAKALLESDVLILRKPIGLTVARAALAHPRVEDDTLILEAPAGPLRLMLGAVEAGRWLKAIQTPPPSLASKLGITPGLAVWAYGDLSDPTLVEALTGITPSPPAAATLGVARAKDAETLVAILAANPPSPLWIIHGKGKGVFGDNDVRAVMRAAEWIDTKVSAVSGALSATRYGRR